MSKLYGKAMASKIKMFREKLLISELFTNILAYLASQQPPQQSNAVKGLVVARNGNVDESEWRISIAKRNNRNVHIRRFSDWLMIECWVCYNQQPRLTEGCLNLVGEST